MDRVFQQKLLEGDVRGLAKEIRKQVQRFKSGGSGTELIFRHRKGAGQRSEPRSVYTYSAQEPVPDITVADATAEALIRDLRKDRFPCPRCTNKSVGVAGWIGDELLLTCGCHFLQTLYFEGGVTR